MSPTQFRGFTLSLDAAAALCADHHLAEPVALRRVPKGEVSAVFFVDLADGDGIVLKVYLRNQNPQLLVAEEEILGHLRRHSNLPVPGWSALRLDGGSLGSPYALHQKILGTDADALWPKLDLDESARMLRRCGELLARLHRVSLSGAGLRKAGVGGSPSWFEREEHEFTDAVSRLRQQGWAETVLLDRAEEVWRSGREIRAARFDPVLCHGDFQLWNLLMDPQTLQPTGLLDLGQAYLGPASADLRDLELNLFIDLPRLRNAFLRGYGGELEETERERLRQAALARALSLMAAYWGPTQQITPAKVWRLLAPWSEDAED